MLNTIKTIKQILHTKPEANCVESFTFHTESSDEMEQKEIAVKLESVRLVLESCVDRPGHFQMEKIEFVKDFVRSLGFGMERAISEDIWNSKGIIRIYSTARSKEVEAALAEQGLQFLKRYLMEYQYQEVRVSSDTIKPVFKMEPMNTVKTKKIGK